MDDEAASAGHRCRRERGSCDPSPSFRRRNPRVGASCADPLFCRLDRLAVDDRGASGCFAAQRARAASGASCPRSPPRCHRLELAEDVVDRRARRKAVARQVAPRAAGPQQIQDRIHRRAHVGLARPAAGLPPGSAAPAPPIPRPSGRSETAPLRADTSAMLVRPHAKSPEFPRHVPNHTTKAYAKAFGSGS